MLGTGGVDESCAQSWNHFVLLCWGLGLFCLLDSGIPLIREGRQVRGTAVPTKPVECRSPSEWYDLGLVSWVLNLR